MEGLWAGGTVRGLEADPGESVRRGRDPERRPGASERTVKTGKNQQRNKEESTSGGEEPRSQRRGGGLQPNAAGRLWVPRTVRSPVTLTKDKR